MLALYHTHCTNYGTIKTRYDNHKSENHSVLQDKGLLALSRLNRCFKRSHLVPLDTQTIENQTIKTLAIGF